MRVAIAEDSVLLREGLTRLLEEAGYQVVAAEPDAERFLRAVAADPPDAAVIVVERDVAVLPLEALGGLGDPLTVINRAEKEAAFREQLADAASDYAASRWADPAFAAVVERGQPADGEPEPARAHQGRFRL